MANNSEPRDALRVDYDDQLDEVVDKANRVLRQVGLSFVDDNAVHDGYCLYELREVSGTTLGDRVFGSPIADRILQAASEFVFPLAHRLSVSPGESVNLMCEPLSRRGMPSLDATMLSLSLAPDAAGSEDLTVLWIDDLRIDGQTVMSNPRPASDFSTPTEWIGLFFVPSANCKILLRMTNRGSSEVHFSGHLRCRRPQAAIEAEMPVATSREIAATREVARQLRRIADELDQSGGSLCAHIEDQHTHTEQWNIHGEVLARLDDRQTIVIERRRTS